MPDISLNMPQTKKKQNVVPCAFFSSIALCNFYKDPTI